MVSIIVPTAEEKKICTMCGKEFEKDTILVADCDMCPDCRNTYKDMAYIFCNKCNKVVTRAYPGVMHNGYTVVPGQLLHVRECPTCSPGIIKSIPVEIEEFENAKGR